MTILGIKNRAENWKTAHCFSPMFRDRGLRLKLVRRLGEPGETDPSEVHLELFWKGMRDHLHQGKQRGRDTLLSQENVNDLAERYQCLFPGLRDRVEAFGGFGNLKDSNYIVSTSEERRKLANNLFNTEIDIVLSTPTRLYIGEAKDEAKLRGQGDLVLVHQLVRQYVTARILIDRLVSRGQASPVRVVPFLVRNKSTGREQAQVDFMVERCWMERENALTWNDINELSCDS